ncbi:MAG: histidinol-phosphatase [Ruminococcus sp.]|nr:histidinol-phosphatase [Ruminococcus sp.]
MKFDFHSHILPGIDDGAKDIEESVKLLDDMAADGVDLVVATPHFYCMNMRIDRYLRHRNAAYEKLRPYLKPEHPRIILGGEILFDHSLVGNDKLPYLTMQNTDFLLLEMPYAKLDDQIIRGVEAIVEDRQVKVIIAHIERYLAFTSYKSLCELMNLDVLGQINAESLAHFGTRRNCFKLIEDGYVHIMGTDMHRIERGYASLGKGMDIIRKKFGNDILEEFERNGKMVLKNYSYEQIVG